MTSPVVEKDGKLIVPIEWAQWLHEEFRRINNAEIRDISFTLQGESITIPENVLETFRFTGLGAINFVDFELYKPEAQKEFMKVEKSLLDPERN